MTSDRDPTFRERLWTPARWWLFAALLTGSVWLAYQHVYGPRVSIPAAAGVLALCTAGLIAYGRVRVEVDDASLVAGRARLPLWAVGAVDALDPAAARAARGVEADPRAYLLLRGYLPAGVRITIADPDDPVPYWYVSTRRPEELAAALEAARSAHRAD